ncbi:BF3164 family lipoprotein [Balneola vulgaris]|uniref:BF3164 family lipoprotein n=1 Tax=Balneola vulgaris TaxID=287535 RepID=UPI0003635D90|nr:BF3164 family lipoprotein [Balneola vulgaris]
MYSNNFTKYNLFATAFLIFAAVNTALHAQSKVYGINENTIQNSTSEIIESDIEFYQANDLLILNGKVIVTDRLNTPIVHVFTFENQTQLKQINSFGNKGRGPGDFEDPWVMFSNDDSSMLYVYDAVNKRIATYSNEFELLENDYIILEGLNFFTNIFTNNNVFYGAGITPGCQLLVFDIDGKKVDCIGKHPDLNLNTEVSIITEAQRWHSYAVINFKENRIALFYRHAIRAALIDFGGSILKEEIDSHFGVPLTEVNNGNAYPADADMRAFIAATSNDDFIYALYSGEVSNGPSSSLGKYVIKYDWNLNKIATYKLDHSSISIYLDDNNMLYSIEFEPESRIRLLKLE